MTQYTAEQVQQRYIEVMGEPLGRVYHRLWNDCSALHWKWAEFVTLYGTNDARIKLLNATASGFFRIVQMSLFEDVLLNICRLTDGEKSRVKPNLTICRLPGLIDPVIRDAVDMGVSIALTRSEFARDWRNRRIGHNDLALATEDGAAIPLAPASRLAVSAAIKAIAKLLNVIEGHYCQSEVMYDALSHVSDAEGLLYVLRDGLEARDEYHRRLENGEVSPSEFLPHRPI